MNSGKLPRRLSATNLAVKTHLIRKRFGDTIALSSLDLTVPENSFYVLVGPNGAGKSTTIRILLDIVRADAGTAEVFGLDTRDGAKARAQIGWVPDSHNAHYTWMRAGQLIASHSSYYPTWDGQYAKRLIKAFSIDTSRRLNRLSKGEIRRVQLLLALAHRPLLLLLDEPTDGLDPDARETVLGILAEHIADSEATVLVSTHLVYEMERLADHIGVIRDGTLAAQLTREELESRLRSYSLEVPADWKSEREAERNIAPLRKHGRQRELEWTIWGEEKDVTDRLSAHGAMIRDVRGVTLEDAAIALMSSGRKTGDE
jgi:ABC-2 type transport system ATP-binding protein